MNVMRTLGTACLLLCFMVVPLAAAEIIHSFDSKIEVKKDGTLIVTETIKVRAEGRNIKRGIYRHFPLLFERTDGKKRKVGQCQERPEPRTRIRREKTGAGATGQQRAGTIRGYRQRHTRTGEKARGTTL